MRKSKKALFKIYKLHKYLIPNLKIKLPNVNARGRNFFCSEEFPAVGHLGVDLLYLPPRQSFPLHTHPGHHILLVIKGAGTVTAGKKTYKTEPGDLFLINAEAPHAVAAGQKGHWLLSFGAPHKHLKDPKRMKVVRLK